MKIQIFIMLFKNDDRCRMLMGTTKNSNKTKRIKQRVSYINNRNIMLGNVTYYVYFSLVSRVSSFLVEPISIIFYTYFPTLSFSLHTEPSKTSSLNAIYELPFGYDWQCLVYVAIAIF